jgi:D-sedoheptulose 7-phosphate isomerase
MVELVLRERAMLLRAIGTLDDAVAAELARAAMTAAETIRGGGTIFFCGNGGSASQAQHLATELVVKLGRERRPFRSVALGTNVPLVTATANDLGYDQVWLRELSALARPGDLLVALTTSGRSPNVLRALEASRSMGVKVVGLLGRDGGVARASCDIALVVPLEDPQRVQEAHLFLGHLFCQLLEAELMGWPPSGGA